MVKKPTLKSLEEFNDERRALHRVMSDNLSPARPNGIACPKCGKELMDSDPSITLTSCPPQKNIHCKGCGYKGYRVA